MREWEKLEQLVGKLSMVKKKTAEKRVAAAKAPADHLTLSIVRELPTESGIIVTRPIPVIVERIGEGESFVAQFQAANVNASGDTPAEAVENFKDVFAAKFRILSRQRPKKLGQEMRRQFSVIQEYAKETAPHGPKK